MAATQANQTSSPIINFASAIAGQKADVTTPDFRAATGMAAAPRSTPAQRRRRHADGKLIELCMEVTANMAAADGAFKADPSGNNDFAAAWDDIYRSRADQAMRRATKMKAHTPDGVRSKAAVAEVIHGWIAQFACEPEHAAFLASFTADVIRMQKAILEKNASSKRCSEICT